VAKILESYKMMMMMMMVVVVVMITMMIIIMTIMIMMVMMTYTYYYFSRRVIAPIILKQFVHTRKFVMLLVIRERDLLPNILPFYETVCFKPSYAAE
jgi:hypothetical protein